jgi:esterase/lipase superfamily enzyme
MVAQLRSLFGSGPMKTVLGAIGENITKRLDSLGVTLRQSITISHSAAGDPVCYGDEGHLVDVWFGTNRVRNSSGSYIAERAATTMYGRCRVFVPCNRPLGSLGSAFFDRLVFGDNRVKVRLISQLDCQKFWKALSGVTLSTEEEHRHGVIFVHGYNTTFKDAARRAAQLKVDLAHRGPVAFFSWPSLNFALGYICDGAAIEASELALRQFLIDFVERSGVSSVHVIAHSMGNRALIRALDAIANNVSLSSSIRFGQIIIAAPDVDAQVFQNLGEAYTKLSKRATLYVTANDTAIGWSRRLHGFPRAGLTPPVTIVPGVDTVDASDINIGLLGHSYAVELRPLLGDIHRLVQKDTPPDERFGLRRASDAFPIYWEFQR